MKRIFVLCFILGYITIAGVAHSQIIYGQKPYLSPRLVVQTWTTKTNGSEQTTSQWVFPLNAYIPLADNLEVRVRSGFSGATWEPSGGDAIDLGGMVDTRIQGAYALYDDRLLVNFGVSVPTGKTALTSEESSVASNLSSSALGFPVKKMGEGLGLSFGGAYAEQFGPAVIGTGLSYLRKGKYDPYENATDYKPGDETVLTAGIDFPGERTLVRTNVVYTVYGADTQDDEDIIKNGSQTDLSATFAYRGHPLGFYVTVLDIMRGKNSYALDGELKEEDKNSHGNDLRIYTGVRYALSTALALKGTFQLKQIDKNEYDFGDASVMGFGGGLQWVMGTRLTLDGGVKIFTGSMNDESTDISGMEIAGGCSYTL